MILFFAAEISALSPCFYLWAYCKRDSFSAHDAHTGTGSPEYDKLPVPDCFTGSVKRYGRQVFVQNTCPQPRQ